MKTKNNSELFSVCLLKFNLNYLRPLQLPPGVNPATFAASMDAKWT